MFQNLNEIDRRLRTRLEAVANTARNCGESGIVDWAIRAAEDAIVLGRVRDKDLRTLERLEGTFAHDFYRNSTSGETSVYA